MNTCIILVNWRTVGEQILTEAAAGRLEEPGA